MFLIYLLTGAIAVALYLVTTQPFILMVAIFMAGFGVNGIFAGSGPFPAEIIGDTSSRGFLMGLAYNGGRLGGFIAPLLIGAVANAGGFTADWRRPWLLSLRRCWWCGERRKPEASS